MVQENDMASVFFYLLGVLCGLPLFMQIVYPLFGLVPKARQILKEEEREKSLLTSVLLFSPVVWTTVLLFSVLIVTRYFPFYWKPYMFGLVTVLGFVIIFVQRRKQDIEDDMIRKVKDRLKLTDSDAAPPAPWED
jgi:amino acid transporter